MRKSLIYNWWLSGGVMNNFSSFTLSEDNPIVLADTDNALREQGVVNISGDTYALHYAVGETNSRLGIKYGTFDINDIDNVTKIDSFLVESNPVGWDTDIEGGDIIKLDDGSWVMAYADEQTGKVGIATRAAGSFGVFTKSPSNPVIDKTADVGAWNRYIRHVAIIKEGSTYYMFYEARTNPLGNAPSQSKIGRATSTDLVTWTHDADPLIERGDFSDNYLAYNDCWMPSVVKIDDLYYLIYMAVPGSGSGADRSSHQGWVVARASSLAGSFEVLNTERPLVPIIWVAGSWDTRVRQEPSFFIENGNVHVHYNSTTVEDGEFKIGRIQLTRGSFNNTLLAAQLEDNFDDDSIDTSKWLATNVGGITVTEADKILKIEADGSTQALTDIFEDITGWLDQSTIGQWGFSFDYFRSTVSGGECEIGISNAAGTNKVVFAKGSTLTNIRIKITLASVLVLNQEVNYQANSLKIVRDADLMSFWHKQNGEWVNITTGGDSAFGVTYFNVRDWASEQLYIKVMAANSTTPYSVRLNDFKLTLYNSPVPSVSQISANDELDTANLRLYTMSSQEKAAIQNFVEACQASGNWDLLDEIFVFDNNSTVAPIGLKKFIATNNGATHVAGGYDFDGTDDYLMSGINTSTLHNYSLNDALVSVYVETVGDESVTRALFDSSVGTTGVRLFAGGGNISYKINNITPRTRAGSFDADKIYTIVRTGSATGDANLYIDGVLQVSSAGSASSSLPNDELEIGRLINPGNYFDGTIGLVAIGAAIGFDHTAWNTDVRQLIADMA